MEKIKKLIEAVDACADVLDNIHSKRPELASEASKQGVERWRNRIIVQPGKPLEEEAKEENTSDFDLAELIAELLTSNGIEDVLDILETQHEIDMTIEEMIDVVGKEAYIDALRRDAKELVNNSISYSQVATLWNDLGRPALGGVNWNSRSVSILIE